MFLWSSHLSDCLFLSFKKKKNAPTLTVCFAGALGVAALGVAAVVLRSAAIGLNSPSACDQTLAKKEHTATALIQLQALAGLVLLLLLVFAGNKLKSGGRRTARPGRRV